GDFVFEFLRCNRPTAASIRSPIPAPSPAASAQPATAVPACRTNPSPANAAPADAAPHAPGSSAASDAAPASPATAPAAAAPASPGPPSTTPATSRSAANAPASPNPPGRSSASPRQSPSPAADAPAPTARLPVPPLRETPARSRTPPPPPARPAHETAENTAAVPASRWSPVPPVQSCLLLPAPSCNRISGEDLRQRGSSRASFRACASSTYSTLGGTSFWSSLHLSGVNRFAFRESVCGVEGPLARLHHHRPQREFLPRNARLLDLNVPRSANDCDDLPKPEARKPKPAPTPARPSPVPPAS